MLLDGHASPTSNLRENSPKQVKFKGEVRQAQFAPQAAIEFCRIPTMYSQNAQHRFVQAEKL